MRSFVDLGTRHLFKIVKKKNPELKLQTYDYNDFKKIIQAYNSKIENHIITTPYPFKLPWRRGWIMVFKKRVNLSNCADNPYISKPISTDGFILRFFWNTEKAIDVHSHLYYMDFIRRVDRKLKDFAKNNNMNFMEGNMFSIKRLKGYYI